MVRVSRAAELGWRRINWVRIDLTGDVARAEVHGVGQHRPVTRTVPLHLAAELAAEGVRTVVRRPAPPTAADEHVEAG